jgi:uncharacterized lipoprotein YmbA
MLDSRTSLAQVDRMFVLVALILIAMLAGCGSSPSARLYLLAADSSVPVPSATGEGPTVLVGPVELPVYLDRPQIVTRTTPTEIELAEFDRWAEPLKINLPSVLRDNLAILLNAPATRTLHIKQPGRYDYQVSVTVSHLEAGADGTAVLTAQWQIQGSDGEVLVPMRQSHVQEAVDPEGGISSLVVAESAAVAKLSREIAEAVMAQASR